METISETVARTGYVFLPEFQPDAGGEVVAARLGAPLSLGDGGPLHRLVPTPAEQTTPNTYSGLHGLNAFPFHTDLAHHATPPPYFMLRCVTGFAAVVTYLLDGLALVRAVEASLLTRALVQPRRPMGGRRPLLPLFMPHRGNAGLLRWDETFIQPASAAGEEAYKCVVSEIAAAKPIGIPLTCPGDTLVIDNWRMLHARSPVPSECRGRIIERAYFKEIM